MQTKVQLTLDFGNYEKRSPASRDQFIQTYSHILESFVLETKKAFDIMTSKVGDIPPIEIEPRLRAVMLNGMICGRMMRLYPDFCMRRKFKRASFMMGDMNTFIKKLDNRLLPGNALSKYNLALRKQLTPPNEEANAVIWMGYTVDEYWMRLNGFHVVYVVDNTVLWDLDIEDHLAFGDGDDQLPKVPVSPIAPVEPKLKKGKETRTIEL